MFDIVDTVFSYKREFIICLFLQDFSKGKGSSLQLFCNAHTAFLLCGAVPSVLIQRLCCPVRHFHVGCFIDPNDPLYSDN